MYPQGSNNYQLNFSGWGCWLTIIAIAWLLGAVGLGWLIKSLVVLFGLLLIAPVLAFIGFRWWFTRNLVESPCPVCQTPLTSLNQAKITCPNCQTPLQATLNGFERFVPDGTVEVSAVDITENREDTSEAVKVEVEVLPPSDDNR